MQQQSIGRPQVEKGWFGRLTTRWFDKPFGHEPFGLELRVERLRAEWLTMKEKMVYFARNKLVYSRGKFLI